MSYFVIYKLCGIKKNKWPLLLIEVEILKTHVNTFELQKSISLILGYPINYKCLQMCLWTILWDTFSGEKGAIYAKNKGLLRWGA